MSLVFWVVFFLGGLFFANNTLAANCPSGATCDTVGDCRGKKAIEPTTRCDTGLGFEGTCCESDSGGSDNGGDTGGSDCPGGECVAIGTCVAAIGNYCKLANGVTGACCVSIAGGGNPQPEGGNQQPESGNQQPVGGAPTGPKCTGPFQERAGICFPMTTGLSSAPVGEILYKLVLWLLAIVGFIGIIAFTISGMQYLLSAGSEEMAKTAKNSMKYSIIGMVVALSGLVIIFFIHEVLSGGLVMFIDIGF